MNVIKNYAFNIMYTKFAYNGGIYHYDSSTVHAAKLKIVVICFTFVIIISIFKHPFHFYVYSLKQILINKGKPCLTSMNCYSTQRKNDNNK